MGGKTHYDYQFVPYRSKKPLKISSEHEKKESIQKSVSFSFDITDKQSGSIALLNQLMNYNGVGIFATHDTAISTLIDTYPDHIRNLCFEISIEDDRMEIDYKLRPGVCKNLNASYLMKKMGIVLE